MLASPRSPYIAKRYPYLTNTFEEWGQYEIEWPEYDPVNQTYFNLSKSARISTHLTNTLVISDERFDGNDISRVRQLTHPYPRATEARPNAIEHRVSRTAPFALSWREFLLGRSHVPQLV